VMAEINADILVVQEADRRLGERRSTLPIDQIEDATGLRPVAIRDSAVSLGWHGNALLLGPRTDLRRTERLTLAGLEPRGAVLAELDTANGPLRVVATHLGLLWPDRARQLRQIRAWLSNRPEMPTTILGDFNDWSPNASQIALGAAFQVHAPGRSFHAAWSMAALDRIATNHRLDVHGGGMMEPARAQRASDHLPVWLDVRTSGTTATE